MTKYSSVAIAHPNIALIKYWGNKDEALRIPQNDSISFSLNELHTQTAVEFDTDISEDSLCMNDEKTTGKALRRMSEFLDIIRTISRKNLYANVTSRNNFPTSAGIASSASAFAALALAATGALGIHFSERQLSRLARRGSGSACRSIPSGFVYWKGGNTDKTSYAYSIAAPDHWKLVDCIAVIQTHNKDVGSTEGQRIATSSPLQRARVLDAPRRLAICREAILARDFEKLSEIVELDSNSMHAVMMTSSPPLFYWRPESIHIIKSVLEWRKQGIPVFYTFDAGPNAHVITTEEYWSTLEKKLLEVPGVQSVLIARPGLGAELLKD
jgi:diphosphomevalonate decarboxylase